MSVRHLTVRLLGIVTVAIAVAAGLVAAPATVSPAPAASAASASGWNAGNIISDAVFYNSQAMDAAAIQAFLNGKVTRCATGYTCLKDYRQNTDNRPADRYCDGYTGRANESAAEILDRVARSCGVSQQVLLVLLQKEQGLITSTAPSKTMYSAAMGQGCPDTAPCDPATAGFFYQVYYAARQYEIYRLHPTSFGYQAGRWNNILYHPDSSRNCGSARVYIENQATAGLYIYTPYVPNAAALSNLYGTGDSCSSYGNRNFWRLFTDWFGSTQYVPTDTPFVDVSSQSASPVYNVFASDIVWLSSMGISTGWGLPSGAREFRPAAAVTRDVMAAFLYRLAGAPAFTAPAESTFVDVPSDHVFYKEISWLASTGVSVGWESVSGWEFRPAESVTRDVMAAFLYRFAGSPSFVPPSTSAFVDVPADHVFYKEIAWMAASRISIGWSGAQGTEFRPGAAVSRDVMAAFLHRVDGYLNPFADVAARPGAGFSVFARDIAWLSFSRISGGWTRPDGTREYRPASAVTRDVMATFLYRLAGEPAFTPPAVSPFVDVPTNHVFYREIAWLASTGISVGWQSGSTTEFQPLAPVTRDVMAAFLYRFAGEPAFQTPASPSFVDVPPDHVFAKEIAWMASTRISVGWALPDGGSEFRPSEAVTRDVMAAFLHRLHAYLNTASSASVSG